MTIDRVSGDGRSMRILRGLSANVSFLGCTSDSAKANLVTHVDGSGHQVWNIVQAQAGQGAYNIVVFRGRPGERRSYLSCTPDGTGVELVDHDDGSGRQRWLFDRIAGPVPDYYAIRASISIAGRRPLYLSCTPDGTRVDLFGADDGSGRQRWQLQDLRSWMIGLRSEPYISELSIPGTHDTLTFVTDSINSYTKCQTLSLVAQLNTGIRYVDIRLKEEGNKLVYCHGPFSYRQTFDLALKEIVDFLLQNPSEFVIMSVKNDGDESATFQTLVEQYFANTRVNDRMWKGTHMPSVNEVRGRIVLVRRYGNYVAAGANPRGIDISGNLWPKNDTGHNTNYLGEKFAIQDKFGYYGWATIGHKWDAVASFLDETRRSNERERLFINFLSATGGFLPAPSPGGVANNINQRLKDFLTPNDTRRMGVIVMDYPTDAPSGIGDVNIRSIIRANPYVMPAGS